MDILSTDKDHYYLKQYSYKISQTFINSRTFIFFLRQCLIFLRELNSYYLLVPSSSKSL